MSPFIQENVSGSNTPSEGYPETSSLNQNLGAATNYFVGGTSNESQNEPKRPEPIAIAGMGTYCLIHNPFKCGALTMKQRAGFRAMSQNRAIYGNFSNQNERDTESLTHLASTLTVTTTPLLNALEVFPPVEAIS